jgi:uncharacterized membrane-anchored protein YhcB (DUF1043 family)
MDTTVKFIKLSYKSLYKHLTKQQKSNIALNLESNSKFSSETRIEYKTPNSHTSNGHRHTHTGEYRHRHTHTGTYTHTQR